MNSIDSSNIAYIKRYFKWDIENKRFFGLTIKFEECYIVNCDEEMHRILESDQIPDSSIKYLILNYDNNKFSINSKYPIDCDKFRETFSNIEGVLFHKTRMTNTLLIKNDYLGMIGTLSNLKYLYIDRSKFSSDKFYRLPQTLKYLEMYFDDEDDEYDFTDMLDMLPPLLEVFITNNTFQSELANLPQSLKRLIIVGNNQPKHINSLPYGLEELVLWNTIYYNDYDNNFVFPENYFDNLPSTLKTLFIYNYGYALNNIPDSLEQLIINNWSFDGIIYNLSANIHTFICYEMVNIVEIVFPVNLKTLILEKFNYAILEKNIMPDSITTLKVNNVFELISKKIKFPESLDKLYSSHQSDINNVIDTSQLPATLKKYCILYKYKDIEDQMMNSDGTDIIDRPPNYKIKTGNLEISFKHYNYITQEKVILGRYFGSIF